MADPAGKMFLVDLQEGRVVDVIKMKQQLATAKPYRQWIEKSRYFLNDLPVVQAKPSSRKACSTPSRHSLLAGRPQFILARWLLRRRSDRLDGQRCRVAGIVEQKSLVLRLLSAVVCASDQSADRPDPRRDRDVAHLVIGPRPNLLGIDETDPPLRLEVHQPVLSSEDFAKLLDIGKLTQGRYSRWCWI